MFTENQINALILAEQLVLKTNDASVVNNYSAAIDEIKALLDHTKREKADLLTERTRFNQNIKRKRTSNNLSDLQLAVTNFLLLEIEYTNQANETSSRLVEPFAVLSTQENWLLIAWCRLRNEFRYFRLDRIRKMQVLSEKFTSHKLTLQEYFEKFY